MPNVNVTGASVTHQGKLRVLLDNADPIEVDHAVVAIGIEPNTELAETSGLELDENIMGFKVNAELEARYVAVL